MIRTRPRWLTAARLPANARASFSSAIDPLSHAPLHVGDVVQACSSSDGRFCLKRPSHGKPCWARSWRCADHPHACPAINIDRYHPGMGLSSAHKSSAHHSTVQRRFRRVHVRTWPPATTTASAGAAALGPGPRARGPATMSSLRPTDVTVRAQCGFNHSRKNHLGTRCTGVREGRLRVASSLAQRVSGRCPTHLR